MLNSAYFTTESYPAHQRLSAWRGTLERLSLHVRSMSAGAAMHGTVSSAVSPQGMTFANISSGPQELSYQQANRSGAICLTLHLEGEAVLVDEARRTSIDSGDIVFGPTGATGGLSLQSNFRQLLVTIPRETFRSRLPTPLSLKVGRLHGHSGIGQVFSGMLGSVADKLDQLTIAQLRPIEIALSEFLVSNLADPDSAAPQTGVTQAHNLHRISQHIETRLSDPALCVDGVAQQIGVSTRYLQKLFESAGETFTHYVRLRRLERCRADLVNPLFAHLSISDICFRWSFNDAAHFSRAFREQYRVSPRAYRREVGSTISKKVLLHSNRSWPGVPERLNEQSARTPHAPRVYPGLQHHRLPLSTTSLHSGKSAGPVAPALEIASGDVITLETLSAHCSHESERMFAVDAIANPHTGPIAVREARVGDSIEVRILDVQPRTSAHPEYQGRSFGSHVTSPAAATYYELMAEPGGFVGRPLRRVGGNDQVMQRLRIPLRPHFASISLAGAAEADGIFDDPRVEKGTTLYLPVRVPQGLLSVGVPRATSVIDASLTATLQIILHRNAPMTCPLLETAQEWILRANIDVKAGVDAAIAQVQQKLFDFLCRSRGLSAEEADTLVAVAMEIEVRKVETGWCVLATLKRQSVIGHSASGAAEAEQRANAINA